MFQGGVGWGKIASQTVPIAFGFLREFLGCVRASQAVAGSVIGTLGVMHIQYCSGCLRAVRPPICGLARYGDLVANTTARHFYFASFVEDGPTTVYVPGTVTPTPATSKRRLQLNAGET